MVLTGEPAFRLGIIGAGVVAAQHVRAVRHLPRVTVAAICDIRADAVARLAAQSGATAYAAHQEMLDVERLDAVIVTSPHALHADMTLDAARAGVHVLVEKPMATSVADCTAMIEGCAAAGVVLAVGHVMRFDSNARRTRRVLATGEIGPVRAIHHRRTAHYERGTRPAWFFDPVLAGGGIVMNVGTHGLDRIQWLGGGEIETVHAHAWNRGGLAIETDAMGLLGLSGGVKASFLFTSAGITYTDETVVICENGSLRWSATDGTWLSRRGAEQQIAAPDLAYDDAFATQLRDFVDACRSGREPAVGGDYGRSVVAAVLAVYESAETGRSVTVPSDLARSAA
jgi:predicted dehydrogenase